MVQLDRPDPGEPREADIVDYRIDPPTRNDLLQRFGSGVLVGEVHLIELPGEVLRPRSRETDRYVSSRGQSVGDGSPDAFGRSGDQYSSW
jgi:hypothetical protein